MKITELRKLLRGANLSDLSRRSGIHIRTLRRIRHGHTEAVRANTVKQIMGAL